MKLESLVNADQPRGVEYVLELCTHSVKKALGSYEIYVVQVNASNILVLERSERVVLVPQGQERRILVAKGSPIKQVRNAIYAGES